MTDKYIFPELDSMDYDSLSLNLLNAIECRFTQVDYLSYGNLEVELKEYENLLNN